MSNLQLAVPKEPSCPINLIILCLVIGNAGIEPAITDSESVALPLR